MKKFLAAILIFASLLAPLPAFAQVNVLNNACQGNTTNPICDANANGKGLFGAGSLWEAILNMITFLGGAAAVLVITVAGIRYITSNGNASTVSGAKTAIIYASIGLALMVSANLIINFVLTNIK